ncbi:MAG TPA: amidohydrolase family protein [Thermodesulfovibrionales bacterium]|nr:amidohydrolase family protein [Thermodesulfovibrionales bacterium]
MKIDIHCHVIGNGKDISRVNEDVYLYADDNQLFFTRMLANLIEEELIRMEADLNSDGTISTSEYFEILYRMLVSSEEIDGVVLLALDAVYSPKTGALDRKRTDLWVSNRFLSGKVKELNKRLQAEKDPKKKAKKFFFGASISPNRKDDWQSELEFVAAQPEAVLIKLIPSTQHIRLRDEAHKDFYRALAAKKMPLLCHVGPEYSFPEGIRNKQLDNFRFLEKPLKYGVTVIAAHCASPVFPMVDRNEIREFRDFMEAANSGREIRLWADTSALSLSTRLPFIQEILETFPPGCLVHGTDFPIPIDSWPHLPLVTKDITPEEYIGICKTKNFLDRDVRIKRAHGFSDSILQNAVRVLRMPA